eukprot:SM000005S17255  [mRNA]  locus=s5:1074597:1080177:- [translate_table: standard]
MLLRRATARARRGCGTRGLLELRARPRAGSSYREAGRNMMLVQSLDAATGLMQWEVVRDEEGGERASCILKDDGHSAIARSLYLDMLNDVARNQAFDQAIKKVVKAGDHVLDIGSGTGLLAMMARRALDEQEQKSSQALAVATSSSSAELCSNKPSSKKIVSGSVTTCESFLPMAKLARRVVTANGMSDSIRVLCKRSDALVVGSDLVQRADVLVSEILDSELLGEGLLSTLRHAHAKLLRSNARVVPHSATIFCQLVECSILQQCIVPAPAVDKNTTTENYGVGKKNWSMHVDALGSHVKLLSAPIKAMDFDFSCPPDGPREFLLEVWPSQAGKVHAIVSWWELMLDEVGSVTYSTAPAWSRPTCVSQGSCLASEQQHDHTGRQIAKKSGWRDHWKQCVWLMPPPLITTYPGQLLQLKASHDDVSITYSIRNAQGGLGEMDEALCTSAYCANNLAPERAWMLQNASRVEAMSSVIRKMVVSKQGKHGRVLHCFILDEGQMLDLLEQLSSHNVLVTCITRRAKTSGTRFLQPCVTSLEQGQHLRLDDLQHGQIDVVLAEPYYLGLEGSLPWRDLLKFWRMVVSVRHCLSKDGIIVPHRAKLRGLLASLPDLWASRTCLADVAGFDHSLCNEPLGGVGCLPIVNEMKQSPLTKGGREDKELILPYAVWQCGEYKLSVAIKSCSHCSVNQAGTFRTMDALRLRLQPEPSLDAVLYPGQSSGARALDAIVLWIDWHLDDTGQHILSSGPRIGPCLIKQGVKLLATPVHMCPQPSNPGHRPVGCGEMQTFATVQAEAACDSCPADNTHTANEAAHSDAAHTSSAPGLEQREQLVSSVELRATFDAGIGSIMCSASW